MKRGSSSNKKKPYHTPLNKKKNIDKAVDEMLDAKIITRLKSPWSFPLVVVLYQSKHITTLYLKSWYWQVQVDEESKEKTAFACYIGLFQFNRMPFGLSYATAVFQELMNIVLQGCENFATAVLDNVLLFSITHRWTLKARSRKMVWN